MYEIEDSLVRHNKKMQHMKLSANLQMSQLILSNKEGKRRKKKNRSLGCRIVSSSLACVQSESQKEETVDEEEKVFEEIL